MTNASTDFLENRVINTYLRNQIVSSSPLFIGLYQYSPSETGENDSEPVGNGYMRLSASGLDPAPDSPYNERGGAIPNAPSLIYWKVINGSATNLYNITSPSATGTWTQLSYIALCSGSHFTTAGSNVYFYGYDSSTIIGKNVNTGEYYSIPAYNITVSLKGAYCTYLANNVLNQYLNHSEVYLPSTNVQLALFRTLPDQDGFNGVEVPKYYGSSTTKETGYVRKNIGNSTMWITPTTGSTLNLTAIDFGTAFYDWGYVSGIGIYESVYGNLLFRAPLDNPRDVLAGDTFTIPISAMKIYLS